jgi:hypothetical protein
MRARAVSRELLHVGGMITAGDHTSTRSDAHRGVQHVRQRLGHGHHLAVSLATFVNGISRSTSRRQDPPMGEGLVCPTMATTGSGRASRHTGR